MLPDRRDALLAYRFAGLAQPEVEALVTTRLGGSSRGPYASLNLGLRVDDDADRVVANRETLFATYDLPLQRSVWCQQVHAARVETVTAETVAPNADGRVDRGAFDETNIVENTDALITNLRGVPLCITIADCAPILLHDPVRGVIGLAHAGRNGTFGRIGSATVRAMTESYGTDPATLRAAIGPAIGPEHYEVGENLADEADAIFGARSGVVVRGEDGELPRLDLWHANRLDLQEAGIPANQIEVAGISTIERSDEFFSHRAVAPTGRMIAAIMLPEAA